MIPELINRIKYLKKAKLNKQSNKQRNNDKY